MIKKIGNWIMIIASIVILAGYLWYAEGSETIIKVFSEIEYRWLFLGLLNTGICWLIDAFILYTLVRSYGNNVPFRTMFRSARVGVMFGLITPLQSGLAPAQMVMLAKSGVRSGSAAAILLYKNIVLLIATSFAIGALLFVKRAWVATLHPLLSIVIILSLVISAAYLIVLVIAGKAQRLMTKIALALSSVLIKLHVIKHGEVMQRRIRMEIGQMSRRFNAVRIYSWKTIRLTLLSLVQMVMLCSSTYFIYRSFGLFGHDYLTVLAGQFFVFAIQSVLPIPGGLGVADGGFYLILNFIFGSQNINFALILWRLYSFYLPIIVGILLLFTQRRREVKTASPEVIPK